MVYQAGSGRGVHVSDQADEGNWVEQTRRPNDIQAQNGWISPGQVLAKPSDKDLARIGGETSTKNGIREANQKVESHDEIITVVSARGGVHCKVEQIGCISPMPC